MLIVHSATELYVSHLLTNLVLTFLTCEMSTETPYTFTYLTEEWK